MTPELARQIATAIVAHYLSVKRDLPWRQTRDPYAIWVSEIMLQQTRVATVIPYWHRWMARFPTVSMLADAALDDVLAAWAGLGYYSRARNLHSGARVVVERHGGTLPGRASELRTVKGIGPYTAGAIASIAFGERAPLVDGNVARVLARIGGIEHDVKSTAGTKALWAAAGELMVALPADAAPGDLNQGLMELGATVCSPTSPRCLVCPVAGLCVARRTGRQDELPVMPRRKAASELPLLARTLVWIDTPPGGVVLARRRAEGLYGGMWELPARDAVERAGVTVSDAVVATHAQTLTHRRIETAVVRASAPSLVGLDDPSYDALARFSFADAHQLGIVAATDAIIRQYEDAPWSSAGSSTIEVKGARRGRRSPSS